MVHLLLVVASNLSLVASPWMQRSNNEVALDMFISQSHMLLTLPLMLLHITLTQHSLSITHLSLFITHHSLMELNQSIIHISLMVLSLFMLHPSLMVLISHTDISPTLLSLYTLLTIRTALHKSTVHIKPMAPSQYTVLRLRMVLMQLLVLQQLLVLSKATGLINQLTVLLMKLTT